MEAVALPTRDHLVATARRLLDAEGLEPLTLREIARRGGLSHGAPLRHFPSLAALLVGRRGPGVPRADRARSTPRSPRRGPRRHRRSSAWPPPAVATSASRSAARASSPSCSTPSASIATTADYREAGAAAFDQLLRAGRGRAGGGLPSRRPATAPRRRRLGVGARPGAALAPGRPAGRRRPRARSDAPT